MDIGDQLYDELLKRVDLWSSRVVAPHRRHSRRTLHAVRACRTGQGRTPRRRGARAGTRLRTAKHGRARPRRRGDTPLVPFLPRRKVRRFGVWGGGILKCWIFFLKGLGVRPVSGSWDTHQESSQTQKPRKGSFSKDTDPSCPNRKRLWKLETFDVTRKRASRIDLRTKAQLPEYVEKARLNERDTHPLLTSLNLSLSLDLGPLLDLS